MRLPEWWHLHPGKWEQVGEWTIERNRWPSRWRVSVPISHNPRSGATVTVSVWRFWSRRRARRLSESLQRAEVDGSVISRVMR